MSAKQAPPLSFRITSPEIRDWLLKQPNRNRVINDALKVHMGYAKWRESDNEGLRNLRTELNHAGVNINQIARSVNVAELSGAQARGLHDLEYLGPELRAIIVKINDLLRVWNG